jgi:RNA polymerase-binding transcription factor DksA
MAQLTKTQTAELQNALDLRHRQLVAQIREQLIRSDEEQGAAMSDRVRDAGDESVVDLAATLGAAIVDHHLAEVRQIEVARERLRGGELNTCVDCGDDIGFARLKASLTAVRCVRCQRLFESTHAGTGSSLI